MGNIADFTRGEPAPVPNLGPSMHDLAIEDISLAVHKSAEIPQSEYPAIVGVMNELEDRKAFGLKKYGTILQANNGRDACRDALDEALDLIVYMRQLVTERPLIEGVRLDSMYRNVIEFAIALKHIHLMSEKANDADGSSTEVSPSDLERGQRGAVPEVPGQEAS